MLSILIISQHGEGLPLYRRFCDEGCITKYYNFKGESFKGIRCVSDYKPASESADLVIITTPSNGGVGEDISERGNVVYGGSRFGNFLITKEGTEAVERLLNPVELEDGVVVSFTGLFQKGKWVRPFYSFLEYNRFMDKDKGPSVPLIGIVGVLFKEGLAVDKIFSQIEFLLEKGNFTGMVEVKVMLYEDDFRVLYIKPLISASLYAISELITIPFSDFLHNPFKEDNIFRYNKVSMSSMLSIPPFPYDLKGNGIEAPLINLERAKKHLWLMDPIGQYFSLLGWSTAWGKDFIEAHRRTYRTIRNIVNSQDVQYRDDIGFRKINAEDVFFILKQWGWIDAIIERKVKESV